MAVHFQPYRSPEGQTGGAVKDFLAANSVTLTLGDTVDFTGGGIQPADAGDRLAGVLIGFVKDLGNGQVAPLDQDAAGSVTGTRSGNAGVLGSDTYVTASDNFTVDKVMGRVIVDPNMEYYNDSDGNLAGDAEIGTYFDIVQENQIDESTGADNGHTTAAQFILMERDPHNDADTSKGVWRIVETYWHR